MRFSIFISVIKCSLLQLSTIRVTACMCFKREQLTEIQVGLTIDAESLSATAHVEGAVIIQDGDVTPARAGI